MPLYFFSLSDHADYADDVGTELPDDGSARREAVRFAGEVLRDGTTSLDRDHPLQVSVTGEGRRTLFRIAIAVDDHPA